MSKPNDRGSTKPTVQKVNPVAAKPSRTGAKPSRSSTKPSEAARLHGAKLPTPRKPAEKQSDGAAPLPVGKTLSARALGISVLARVAATDGYLNVVLDTFLDEHPLKDERDAGLVTELCYGATRRRLALDAALQVHSKFGLETLEDRVLAALRIGAYQIFFTRVPRHAAVADTVEALKQLGLHRATGFVNAVLRKMAAQETLGELPLWQRESHPPWLVERWTRQFGAERAEAMMIANNQAASVVVRVNTAKTTRDALLAELREMGVAVEPTTLAPTGLVFTQSGRVEELFGYREGLWQVQDEAAQLVGLFGNIPAGARVLDACAAPGGKACHLAEQHQVLALELHANKLRKILSETTRLGLNEKLTAKACDCSKPLPEEFGEFDAVMIDAPCSGLGTLRRHPELRYRRLEKDLESLRSLQRAILESCQERVAPGGLLVYAVCSTDPTEGADQIEMFLRSHPDFTAEAPTKTGIAFPQWQGHLRTLPGPEGMDGFFAARLRKMY